MIMRHNDLDEIDIEILNILQKDGRMAVKDIAEKVCLSSTAVSNRIEKLEQEKYIVGYQAIVNPLSIGLFTKDFISLEVTPAQKKEFYPYIKKCNNVVECNCVTGDYSMLLEVIFKTTIELDQFIGELQKYGRTRTQIVFSTSVEHRGIKIEISENEAR